MAVSCARLVLMLLMSTALRAGGLQLAGRAVARTRPRRRLALPRVVAVARDAYTDAGAPARLAISSWYVVCNVLPGFIKARS